MTISRNLSLVGTNASSNGTVNITSGIAVASTSGTAINFTGIPSWVKRITVMLSGVSTSGVSAVLVRIGTSSGVVNTGYIGAASVFTNGTPSVSNSTTGFLLEPSPGAGSLAYGSCVITNVTGNTWVASFNIAYGDAPYVGNGAGSLVLGATLDRVQLTTSNGTDTFDAGSINILYE